MARLLLGLVLTLLLLLPRLVTELEPTIADWLPVRQALVGSGDTLERIVLGMGLPVDLVPELAAQYNRCGDHRQLRPNDRLILMRHRKTGRLRLEHYPGLLRRITVTLPLALHGDSLIPAEGWASRLDSLGGVTQTRVISGVIQSSLYESLTAAGGSAQLVLAYADIFQWDVDFLMDIRAGDRFWLAYEERSYAGEWQHDSLRVAGTIVAARFEGEQARIRAARHEGCGIAGYFDAAGRSFQKQFLKSPLNYRRVSSQFGMRNHPVLRRVRMHHGIDYSAPAGTPVVSAANGTVTKAGWESGYGKVIRVKHDRRHATVYGHLSRFAAGLRAGRRVSQNEVIGYVGSTGLSTGPHLHYEFIENGRSIDPIRALNQPAMPVPAACLPDYLEAFRRWHGEEQLAATP